MRSYAIASTIVACAALADCSGGGRTATVPTVVSPSVQPAAKAAQVAFTMQWSSAATSSLRRGPKFVSPSAQSISVTVNQGVAQILNFPQTTLTLDAPVGTDLFTFVAYDAPAGQGNVLGRAAVTKAIIDGAANTVAAVLDGVIASLSIALSNPTPNAGTPTAITVNVAGQDADGQTIVGAANYATPISLAINDPANTGTLTLPHTSADSPNAPLSVNYNGGTLISASVVASVPGVPSASATIAPLPTFYAYRTGTGDNTQYVTVGPDGNIWFTEPGVRLPSSVGMVTPTGLVTEFSVSSESIGGIASGPDGRLWFTDPSDGYIDAITTTGTLSQYPTALANDAPAMLVNRGDGTLWVTGPEGPDLEVVNPAGGTSSVAAPGTVPNGIATGPDNYVYFTDKTNNQIGRIANPGGAISTIALAPGSTPEQIVRGPDGNLWFTEFGTSKIGRLSTATLTVTEFPTLSPNAQPYGITAGIDGALWFTEVGSGSAYGKVGRITTTGQVTEYALPASSFRLGDGIAAAPNGSLYFGEKGSAIGQLVY
jgi:virginiamycin B lyase